MKPIPAILLVLFSVVGCNKPDPVIDIVIPENADNIEILAANELSKYLEKTYKNNDFPVVNHSKRFKRVLLGTKEKLPLSQLPDSIPLNAEGFVVHRDTENTLIITSNGSAGVLYGVYELLGEIGYSFTFGGDYAPPPIATFRFEKWNLTNEPLISERTVFNWHNFLSGCTAWDYEDWVWWINQSQKMGYNTIMVHGYANNPMFTFEHNECTKPVGYLTTSVKGRDWSTEHINDVRRTPGGSIFRSPVFGSKAGIVPEDQRIESAQNLMKRVFQYAEDRGMNVNIALDFDIVAAIPQNMVTNIPVSDKFKVDHKGIKWMGEKAGEVWLPRPDRPEGYRYYKKQIATLLDLYPQIDKFILWRRASKSVWMELKQNEMPRDWQKEFAVKIEESPKIAEMEKAAGVFAQSKLALAYRNAVLELNRDDVDISFGTWNWASLRTMHEFYPDFANIYILDSEVIRGDLNLHNKIMIDDIASWSKFGKVIPVIWPHHDDGAYIGSPLPTFENFNHTLTQLKSNGFGVIHWMTRPFDIFFIHHARQVMVREKDQSLERTLNAIGEKWFGSTNGKIMTTYLKHMMSEMPIFGRETSSHFIDKPHYDKFSDVEKVISQCNARIELLKTVKIDGLSKDQEQIYYYYLNYEIFIKEFYLQQGLFLSFRDKYEKGQFDAALNISKQFRPERALEQFAETIRFGHTSKGEKGLLFSMSARWLPHFLTQKQLVGGQPIRINFAPTSHEALAQAPGTRTYFIDLDGKYWIVYGEKETKETVVNNPVQSDEYTEIFSQGILTGSKMRIKLEAFTSKEALLAGKYKLKLLLSYHKKPSNLEIKIDDLTRKLLIDKPSVEEIHLVVDGKKNPEVEFISQKDNALLCGMILQRHGD